MAQFKGNFSGAFFDSAAARDFHEKKALRHSWSDFEAYVQKPADRRQAIDEALDSVMAEQLGQSAIGDFLKRHPEVETEANSATIARYFRVRGISGPYDAFKLEAAFNELAGDGLIEPLIDTQSAAADEVE